MFFQFSGKVALVTGGSSGMGRATAIAYAKEGIKVVVADRNVQGGEETVSLIKANGGEAIFIQCDVSKEDQVENLVKKTIEAYGRLDTLSTMPVFLPRRLSSLILTQKRTTKYPMWI